MPAFILNEPKCESIQHRPNILDLPLEFQVIRVKRIDFQWYHKYSISKQKIWNGIINKYQQIGLIYQSRRNDNMRQSALAY